MTKEELASCDGSASAQVVYDSTGGLVSLDFVRSLFGRLLWDKHSAKTAYTTPLLWDKIHDRTAPPRFCEQCERETQKIRFGIIQQDGLWYVSQIPGRKPVCIMADESLPAGVFLVVDTCGKPWTSGVARGLL